MCLIDREADRRLISIGEIVMPSLSEYRNVDNTAFNVLKAKGFTIWYDEESALYCAEKDGWDFMADTPCALLGLVAIYEWKKPEVYSEYWWKDPGSDATESLSRKAPAYKSVCDQLHE